MKYLFLDVDGTLTDGKLYIGAEGEMMKAFSVKDGYALGTLCKKAGIIPVIITGRKSEIVQRRCEELGITEIYQGYQYKLPIMLQVMGDTAPSECAYMGDDVLDLECIEYINKAGGLTGCPSDAVTDILEVAGYVCTKEGGSGAVREFVERMLRIEKNISFTDNA